MFAIPKAEAVERLVKAIEAAPDYDLMEYNNEFFPMTPKPDVTGGKAAAVAQELIAFVRDDVEPEILVDLWYTTFPMYEDVGYDYDTDILSYRDRELNYA